MFSTAMFPSMVFASVNKIYGLHAVERNATSIKLGWTPLNSSEVDRYVIYRADLNNNPGNTTAVLQPINKTAGKNGYFTDFELKPSSDAVTQYYKYKVQALSASKEVIGESDTIVVSTSDTNKIKTNFKMLVLNFDPRMSTTVPKEYSNDPQAVSHYNKYFAGKLQSELSGNVVHQRAVNLEPSDCKNDISYCFDYSATAYKNLYSGNFLKQLKNFFKTASLNSFSFDIYNDSVITLNAYPPAKNAAFQQSDSTVFELAYDPKPCSSKGCTDKEHVGITFRIIYDLNSHGSLDYEKLVTTPYPELQGNSIVDLIEEGSIDGVWLMTGPVLAGYRENALMAKKYFGFDISGSPDCSRDFFVTGMAATTSAFDGYCHMFEGMLNERSRTNPDNWPNIYPYEVYDSDKDASIKTNLNFSLVGRFFMTDGANYTMDSSKTSFPNTSRASQGNANCGTSHFPPTSIFGLGDYQYLNAQTMKTYTKSCADDWFLYPNLPSTPNYRYMNGYDYGGFNAYELGENANDPASYDIIVHSSMYHQWWLNHIPHNPGVSDGKLNNWWPYIFDINNFKGETINYKVTGFPEIPTSFDRVNAELGTENDTEYWGYWHSFNEDGRNAEIVSVSKDESSSDVKCGTKSIRVNVNEVGYDNIGRNDIYYPITRNAKWNLSGSKSLNLSLKFLENANLVANGGTNPIIRLYKNNGTRIEYVPVSDGCYANVFKNVQNGSWVDLSIPLSGNSSWKKVVIGYVDPSLTGAAKEAELKRIEDSVLAEVNYIEISIDAKTTTANNTFSFIVDKLYTDDCSPMDAAVENLWLLGNDGTAKIQWDEVEGADSYAIELTSDEGSDVFYAGRETEYTLSNLTNNKSYSVRVCPQNSYSKGDWSRTITFMTKANTSKSMDWTMVFPESGDYYNKFEYVDYSTGVWSFPLNNYAVDGNISITNLLSDRDYMGCLTYYNRKESCYKQIHLHASTLLNKVENLWLLGTENKVKIQWDEVPEAESYKVELTGPSGVNTFDAGNLTEYQFDSIVPYNSYTVRVRAEGTNKIGEWSRTINFMTEKNTSASIVWTIVFPNQGALRNKLEYVDYATGVWSFPIAGYAVDGNVAVYNLLPNRDYMGCLTYYNENQSCYKQIHLHAFTKPYSF